MTESEWLSSNDPMAMLRLAAGKVSSCCGCVWCKNNDGTLSLATGQQCCVKCDNDVPAQGFKAIASERKLRLFACACARQVRDLLTQEARSAVLTAERLADDAGAQSAADILRAVMQRNDMYPFETELAMYPFETELAWRCLGPIKSLLANNGLPQWFSVSTKLAASQAALLRCNVGNPLRPVTLPSDTPNYPLDHSVDCCCGHRDCPGTYLKQPCRWLTPTVIGIAQSAYDERDWDRLPVLADALEDAGCPDEAILTHLRGPGPHARGCWVVDLILGKE